MNGKITSDLRLTLKRQPDNLDSVEESINNVIKHLNSLKNICLDRSQDVFPSNDVRKIVDNCERIMEVVDDISVDNVYFETVCSNKSPYEYFKAKLEDLNREKEKFCVRKAAFSRFHKLLEKVREEKFS